MGASSHSVLLLGICSCRDNHRRRYVGADYYLGKDWVDLDDASVTKDHVRKWRVLQDLKVPPVSFAISHTGHRLLCTCPQTRTDARQHTDTRLSVCCNQQGLLCSSTRRTAVEGCRLCKHASGYATRSRHSAPDTRARCCDRTAMRRCTTGCSSMTSPTWRPLFTRPPSAGRPSTSTTCAR